MLVELIGCTSAGKSTLARAMVQESQARAISVSMGDDHVLRLLRLNWVRNRIARTLLLDLIAAGGCFVGSRKYLPLYAYIARTTRHLPASVPLIQKLNIARNAYKKVGIAELIRRTTGDEQIVLMDEGVVHTAHYLFVHTSIEPDMEDVSTFVELIPLPDVAVYLQRDETELVQRVLKRGHRRIRNLTPSKVERFVQRAVGIFEYLTQQPRIGEKLLLINQRTVVVAQGNRPTATSPRLVLDLLDRVLGFQQQDSKI